MTAPTPRKNPPTTQPPVKGHRRRISLTFTPGGGITLGFKAQSTSGTEKGKVKLSFLR